MMKQVQQERTKAVSDKPAEKLSEQDREVMRNLARRIQEGAKMVDIFGLDDETMTGLELQAYRLYKSGHFDQARVACRGVLALDGERPLTRLLMGDMALEEYRFTDAVEHLKWAYELAPEQTAVRARFGEALLKRGQADLARPHLEALAAGEGEPSPEERKRCQALLDAMRR
jgi:predicted Zn-dependent protease